MKTIETHLTEKQFLFRLEHLCRIKKPYDVGYCDMDVFVVRRKGNRFWLAKHYAVSPVYAKGDGYAADRLRCRYKVSEHGYVTVEYRFAKRPTYYISAMFTFLASCLVGISMLRDIEAGREVQPGALPVVLSSWLIWFFAFFHRSNIERTDDEAHLRFICTPEENDGSSPDSWYARFR